MSSKRPTSAYFPFLSTGSGFSEFFAPIPYDSPWPPPASSSSSSSSSLMTNTADGKVKHERNLSVQYPSTPTSRGEHKSRSKIVSGLLTPDSTPKKRYSRSSASATSSETTPEVSPSPASTRAPSMISSSPITVAAGLSKQRQPAWASSTSPTTSLHPDKRNRYSLSSSSTSPPLDLARGVRQTNEPVLVRSPPQKSSPRSSFYSSIAGSGKLSRRKMAEQEKEERRQLEAIAIPAVELFSVRSILAEIGYSMSEFYETSLDLAEVCESYFKLPEHASTKLVLGISRRKR
ncbi:uncharacterized protein V2V93DRAFT_369662 [Kockiozyma suomiensis]|uniref:uncharacterized protein n=1 Tax=Kockiozyma suomiensis TaxID=1337062 RepID=UPI0033430A7C